MDSSMADRVATRQVPGFSVISSAVRTDLPPCLLAAFWLLALHREPSKDTLPSLFPRKEENWEGTGRGAHHLLSFLLLLRVRGVVNELLMPSSWV